MRSISLVPFAVLALFFYGAGCGSTSSSDTTTPDASSSSSGQAGPSAGAGGLVEALQTRGLTTTKGRFGFIDMSNCCSQTTCFGNNPSSPYACIYLGRGEGQTAPNVAEESDGTSVGFRLRQDEAIVLLAKTPPKAKYFGYTLYVFDRDKGDKRQLLYASLGDTVNPLSIASGAADPFARKVAFVVSANAKVEAAVKEALAEAGVPKDAINALPIPASLVKLGLEEGADTFNVTHRAALFEDAAAGKGYVAAPEAEVLRVTPKSELEAAPHPAPTLRPHGTGTNEASLRASIDALEAAILAKHGRTSKKLAVTLGFPDAVDHYGRYCIENGVNCNGDNNDTLYPSTDPFLLPDTATDAVMVYGVNHQATGKVTYANFVVYDMGKLMGVVAVDSAKLAGSAADFVPNDPNVGKLYAWKVARKCNGAAHCVELPTGCPGVDAAKPAYVQFRTYLEPKTMTSPMPSELEMDRVLRLY